MCDSCDLMHCTVHNSENELIAFISMSIFRSVAGRCLHAWIDDCPAYSLTRIASVCMSLFIRLSFALKISHVVLRKVFSCIFFLLWHWLKSAETELTKTLTIAYGIHETHLDQNQMQRWRVHPMTRHVLYAILYIIGLTKRQRQQQQCCVGMHLRSYINPSSSLNR